MEDFKERLLLFIKAKDMSVRRFEEACGLTNGTIGSIKAQGPTASVVSKIADAFPDLDLNWLFRGERISDTKEAPISPAVSVANVQAVFVTNWKDVREVVEDAVKGVMGGRR